MKSANIRAKRRTVGLAVSLVVVAVCLASFNSTSETPAILRLVSTELSPDNVYLMAKFSLSNASSRTWTYLDSSIPEELWRIKLKADDGWKDGHMHSGYAQTIGWSRAAFIGPGESRAIQVALPADGQERKIGAFLQRKPSGTSKAAAFVRELYARVFHRSLPGSGQFCAWNTNVFAHRALLDRGLLATNTILRMPFDQAEWRKGDAQKKNAMGEHLATSRFLFGKSKAEVLELLGPASYLQDGTGHWSLGFQATLPLYSPEDRILMVTFDSQGVVERVNLAARF